MRSRDSSKHWSPGRCSCCCRPPWLVQTLLLARPGLIGLIREELNRNPLLESKNLTALERDLEVAASSSGSSAFLAPDVFVFKRAERYEVVVNDATLPELRLSDTLRRALEAGPLEPGEATGFMHHKLEHASTLIRAVRWRQRLDCLVTESIVRLQGEFLDQGIAFLKLLSPREVAEDAELHESTVGRALNGRRVQTPHGTFALKDFFHGRWTQSVE